MGMLNDTELLLNLQRANQIALSFTDSLNLEKIAYLATDGLVTHLNCAFARVWLVDKDREILRLIASSGLYTHTDGFFSNIPMGAFKIGKIAQNRASLLSNNLAEESWVRDPEWAIANNLKSFAGYPLSTVNKVIGVLGVFSHHAMRPEFLQVLLNLCTNLTVALEMAALHQQEKRNLSTPNLSNNFSTLFLSDRLAQILNHTKLTVVGTERSLKLSQTQVFLQVTELLNDLECSYCCLTYDADSVTLEAIADTTAKISQTELEWQQEVFGNLYSIASFCGGILEINTEASIKAIQVSLKFPSAIHTVKIPLSIQCRLPLLQTGFTQLAYLAGLQIFSQGEINTPLLTDDLSLVSNCDRVIWVKHHSNIIPDGVKAQINISITSNQLREVVEAVINGDSWGLDRYPPRKPLLSNREQEVIALLAQGMRDRDIAENLYISDSTVKFHVNNILLKLEAKTRMQALYKWLRSNQLES